MEERSFLGKIFNDDCAILFFIIVFLLIFLNNPYYRSESYLDPK